MSHKASVEFKRFFALNALISPVSDIPDPMLVFIGPQQSQEPALGHVCSEELSWDPGSGVCPGKKGERHE